MTARQHCSAEPPSGALVPGTSNASLSAARCRSCTKANHLPERTHPERAPDPGRQFDVSGCVGEEARDLLVVRIIVISDSLQPKPRHTALRPVIRTQVLSVGSRTDGSPEKPVRRLSASAWQSDAYARFLLRSDQSSGATASGHVTPPERSKHQRRIRDPGENVRNKVAEFPEQTRLCVSPERSTRSPDARCRCALTATSPSHVGMRLVVDRTRFARLAHFTPPYSGREGVERTAGSRTVASRRVMSCQGMCITYRFGVTRRYPRSGRLLDNAPATNQEHSAPGRWR